MKKRFKHIYLEITNRCNLKCPFCHTNKKNDRSLSIGQIELIIPQLKKYTDYVYLHVKGEPLIHPYFAEILTLLEKNEMKIKLTTNGVKLLDYVSILKNNKNVTRLNISLQALLGMKVEKIASYLDNIEQFVKSGPYPFPISFRIWQSDDRFYEIIKSFLTKRFNLENFSDKIKIQDGLFLSLEKSFIWPNLSSPINEVASSCLGTVTHIAILSNLDVVMCCLDSEGVTSFGNLSSQSLDSILEGPMFEQMSNELRQGHPSKELCLRCYYRCRFNKK